LDVTVARKAPEQWFIEAVALVPVIFALLFLHLLFLHPRYRGLGLETFLVPLIAAILAILPLRLVLVPSNIEGLTRVDVALGAGLVLTVAVALAKYLWEIWNVKDIGSAGPDGEAVEGADPGV
jgi:amino acid permease